MTSLIVTGCAQKPWAMNRKQLGPSVGLHWEVWRGDERVLDRPVPRASTMNSAANLLNASASLGRLAHAYFSQ